jgi:hypothetical protein
MTINILEYPYDQMTLNSVHGINDLGSFTQCSGTLGDYADYGVLNLNISHLPVVLHFGLCLPKACHEKDLMRTNEGFTNLLNALYSNVDFETNFTKKWSKFEFNIVKSNE